MLINPKIIKELEHMYRQSFTEEFRLYLLTKYSEEPFPYEFSEQDLYENIRHDIRDYNIGKLDVSVKSPSECWQEEREYLQNLCIEKSCMIHDLEVYILELEHILSENNLISSRMVKRRTENEAGITN